MKKLVKCPCHARLGPPQLRRTGGLGTLHTSQVMCGQLYRLFKE